MQAAKSFAQFWSQIHHCIRDLLHLVIMCAHVTEPFLCRVQRTIYRCGLLLLPFTNQGLNSGPQAGQQALLSPMESHQSQITHLNTILNLDLSMWEVLIFNFSSVKTLLKVYHIYSLIYQCVPVRYTCATQYICGGQEQNNLQETLFSYYVRSWGPDVSTY